ncbi:MAG TPA: hypothetical protein VN421_14030 [Pseudoflavonifractor sp.]|nr:hypothetical protein [Pseudoflavonifractor sp.]
MNVTPQKIWTEYNKGLDFKSQLDLYETVKNNENFYIGRQWEGVQSNGLPTPVFNFIKRIILFLVASTAADNIKLAASPMGCTGRFNGVETEKLCSVVNDQFEVLFERNKMGKLIRDFMRNAAVDGDGCIYCWFDPEEETGQDAKGNIRVELLENTRVFFGNPNSPDVQGQPYLIISRRELVGDAREEAEGNGEDAEAIQSDTDDASDRFDAMTDGKVTTLTKFWRDKETGTIWCARTAKNTWVRRPWDTGQKRYPISWLNWDYVPGCYHGQAAVTGLIPNQVFVNKLFAMTMISLMTTAYPKVVYDKTRIAKWDSRVGAAIGVNGGDVGNVARTIDPATISPQVSQFIQQAIGLTKEFMGATDAALGNVRPDNTSAIIALQKASSVPMELTKQNLFQCIEDMGNIWLDLMRVYYGERYVEKQGAAELFDFSVLEEVPLSLKLDVGGSAYWSEIAQMNTLDNLLTQGKISVIDYLERVPNGYISNQQELIETLKEREAAKQAPQIPQQGPQIPQSGASPSMGSPGPNPLAALAAGQNLGNLH